MPTSPHPLTLTVLVGLTEIGGIKNFKRYWSFVKILTVFTLISAASVSASAVASKTLGATMPSTSFSNHPASWSTEPVTAVMLDSVYMPSRIIGDFALDFDSSKYAWHPVAALLRAIDGLALFRRQSDP